MEIESGGGVCRFFVCQRETPTVTHSVTQHQNNIKKQVFYSIIDKENPQWYYKYALKRYSYAMCILETEYDKTFISMGYQN